MFEFLGTPSARDKVLELINELISWDFPMCIYVWLAAGDRYPKSARVVELSPDFPS